MKRFLAFIVLIVYSATTIGATVQLHYCMGKLESWSLVWAGPKSKECNKCGMEKTESSGKGCCHDESKILKVQDDQKVNHLSLEIFKLPVAAPLISNHTIVYSLPEINGVLPFSNAPPRSSGADICIYNCVFRI